MTVLILSGVLLMREVGCVAEGEGEAHALQGGDEVGRIVDLKLRERESYLDVAEVGECLAVGELLVELLEGGAFLGEDDLHGVLILAGIVVGDEGEFDDLACLVLTVGEAGGVVHHADADGVVVEGRGEEVLLAGETG